MAEKKRMINRKIKVPEKRSINLAEIGREKISIPAAILGIIVIAGAAAAFSKTAVIDRFAAVNALEDQEYLLRSQVDEIAAQLGAFDSVSEEYEHYTYSGMTYEELTRADRLGVLQLLDEKVFPYASVDSWTLQGNELYIPLTAQSLEAINQVVQLLESDPTVSFCTVTTAVTEEQVEKSPAAEADAEKNTSEEQQDADEEAITEKDNAAEETETETEETVYEMVTRVKGSVTCYLNEQDSEFAEKEDAENESTQS